MTYSVSLDADVRTIPTGNGVAPSSVVALPPSDLDPGPDQMRVYVDGTLTIRRYDPTMEQP